jgi:putative heme-binding domain-containing protein
VIRTAAVKELPASWLNAIDTAVRNGSISDQREAAACIGSRRLERFVTVLQTLIAETERPAEVRFEAALALAALRLGLDDAPFDLLSQALNDGDDASRAVNAARGLAESQLSGLQLRRLVDQVPLVSPLALPVLLPAFRGSKDAALGTTLISHLVNSPAADNLSAELVAAVLAEFPPDVRSSADPLLKRLGGETIAEQQARLRELSDLISGGNPSDGRIVFLSQAAACSGCHRVGDTGGKVGPDLTHVGGTRTGGDLLEAIVYPSASFVRDFRPSVVLTNAGTTVTGVLARQTGEAITLRTAELKEVTIQRSEIDEMRESPVSIMPKGVDRTLTPQQLRDLLAYLQSLK